MINSQVLEKTKNIQMLVMDIDGVLTDGKLWFDIDGNEYKSFHVHDGTGITLLRENNIPVAIISGRGGKGVEQRLKQLKIDHVYLQQNDKMSALNDLIKKTRIPALEIAYIGDDIQDLKVMQHVGLSIAVSNAVSVIKNAADWCTKKTGGDGAVREVCDVILAAKFGSSHAA